MKESKGANGDLEPEHKKTTQTLIHVVRGQPSETIRNGLGGSRLKENSNLIRLSEFSVWDNGTLR